MASSPAPRGWTFSFSADLVIGILLGVNAVVLLPEEMPLPSFIENGSLAGLTLLMLLYITRRR
ncbi:hypothetical protein [Streptomyces sp. NPDC058667]|uniref:hypothetical protein n=1 Tax=Streptomyces sp. NPDC058667 TaxID=3346588 RepID=UPI00366288F6